MCRRVFLLHNAKPSFLGMEGVGWGRFEEEEREEEDGGWVVCWGAFFVLSFKNILG